MKSPFVLVTTSYKGIDRVRFLLRSIKRYDPSASLPHLIVEDYSGDGRMSQDFDLLREDFPQQRVQVYHRATWGNIQGTAQGAFERAHKEIGAEWALFLSDDTAVSRGALSNMLHFLMKNDLKTVGLVQFPYWNSHDFCREGDYRGEWGHEPRLLKTREDPKEGFYSNLDWIEAVQVNPHWQLIDQSGIDTLYGDHESVCHLPSREPIPLLDRVAFPYVSVHGTGFACHIPTFMKVGGFYPETWRFDEAISYKVWTQSNRGVVALPGPPIVHYGGATAELTGYHEDTDAGDAMVWLEDAGVTVKEADKRNRQAMYEKGAAICEEMANASYWRPE